MKTAWRWPLMFPAVLLLLLPLLLLLCLLCHDVLLPFLLHLVAQCNLHWLDNDSHDGGKVVVCRIFSVVLDAKYSTTPSYGMWSTVFVALLSHGTIQYCTLESS